VIGKALLDASVWQQDNIFVELESVGQHNLCFKVIILVQFFVLQ
jgi:hypothetical protein